MKKSLKATKVKDGWVIEITQRLAVGCETDVRDIIRYEGLRENHSHKPTKENPNEWIYAD